MQAIVLQLICEIIALEENIITINLKHPEFI